MKTPIGKATTSTGSGERESLARSEKDASRQQPGSYKDEETAEKVVSIPTVGPGKKPIRGLDPK
jgi:hypothetical protein